MGQSAYFSTRWDLIGAVARMLQVNRREFLLAAAGLPLALRFPAARAGALGGTPLALVTADSESRIIAFDPTTGRIRRAISTPPGPRSIESARRTVAVVAHTAEGAVSLVDGRSLRVERVLRVFGEPRYTAAGRDGRHAFITDSRRGEVIALDLEQGRVVGRVEVGGPARHISIDPSGRRVWVALGSKAELLALVDVSTPARPRFVRHISPPFLAHDVCFIPGGRHVWVTSGDRGRVAIYDARSSDVLFTLPAGSPPQHVTFVAGRAHVTSGDDGTLRVHRIGDGRLLRLTAVPVGSYNVQHGFGLVLTPSLQRGTLCVLDARGGLRMQVRLAHSSHDACLVMGR